ncbi:MAG: arsenite methyltransferase [candidate division Zixibacteria bacterium]|nr:arsenite methyltransferase [candidate division Zixibacteria bacterium]
MKNDIRDKVRERYGQIAESSGTEGCCGTSGKEGGCGCGTTETADALGYTETERSAIPAGADLGLGCGNPLAHATVKAGETVLDLGSGAGIDAFLASKGVGPSGRVIGVDMTPAMISRARANAAKNGYANVEFRLGEIENLPVANETVDAIISNCVINLSPDKPKVFREALRALKPGGRMIISDLVLIAPLPESVRTSVEAYVGCLAGAAMKSDYVRMIQEAGFERVEVVEERRYGAGGETSGNETEAQVAKAVRSIKVRAFKPASGKAPRTLKKNK